MRQKSFPKRISVFLACVLLFSTAPMGVMAFAADAEPHTHTEDCYAKKGDLLCSLPEEENHTHTEACYAKGGELVCGEEKVSADEQESEEENTSVDEAVVTTADEFIAAVQAGGKITLGSDISVDSATAGTMTVDKDTTIDCAGYTISANYAKNKGLFTVNEGAVLTLVNAQMSIGAGDVIDTNNGTVVVESTKGTGITAGRFVGKSDGTIEVQAGTFQTEEDCFNEIDGSLTIRDATVTVGNGNCMYVLSSGKAEIFGGKYTAPDDCINNQGTVIFHAGASFEATDDRDGCLYSNGGQYEIAEDAIASPAKWQGASKVDFVPTAITIRFYSEGKLLSEIHESPAKRAFPEDPVHSKGIAFCFWGDKDGNKVDDLSALTADTDLYAVFADKTYTVTFNDKGTTTTETVLINTPLGQVPGLDRKENGDNFRCWKQNNEIVNAETTTPVRSNLTLTAVYGSKVMNFEELKAAVDRKDAAIELGADIPVTETITVDYDCIINGNGFGLIRPDGFVGVLLSVENGVTGGDTDSGVQGDGTTLIVNNAKVDGRNVDAEEPAVTAGEGTKLVMDNVTVENNRNTVGDGGGICIKGADVVLKGCTIQNNHAGGSGGGIYAEADGYSGAKKSLAMKHCTVKENSADSDGGGLYEEDFDTSITDCVFDGNTSENGGGLFLSNREYGDVDITNSVVRNNTAASAGGGIRLKQSITHLYGDTTITKNTAASGGGVESSWGDKETCILYLHDSSSITYNTAKKDKNGSYGDGGGVHCDELRLVMYDKSSIDHNTAEADGGGVYAASYGMQQDGGVVRDNHANGSGGGVCVRNESLFTGGMMFDNTADAEGDDLFDAQRLNTLYPEQEERSLGDGNSAALKTVRVEEIPDYYPVDRKTIRVPWYGWFVDGEWDSDSSDYANHYTGDVQTSKLVCDENDNLGILTGEIDDTGVKAIWYGLLLAYDANYEGTTDHQYDEQAYRPGTDVTVKDKLFERPGYRFVGWNTKKDGTGTAYKADQTLNIDHSQVLYAQWEATYQLPTTGGMGTSLLIGLGVLLAAASPLGGVILIRRGDRK